MQARRTINQTLAGDLLSVANLIGCPVTASDGARLGRLHDLIVRWDLGTVHPPLVSLIVKVGNGLVTVPAGEVTLSRSGAQLRYERTTASLPASQDGQVALARDVLDHQLIDVTGVEVVRAADVYLVRTDSGWELGGVDVGMRALLRRIWPRRRRCPKPVRALDWSDLQAFVPRFSDEAADAGPAGAAGLSGSSMQVAGPASALHKLRAKDVAALLAGLDRDRQAQLTTMADSSSVAQALGDLEPAKLDALLAELDPADRTKLIGLLGGGRP